MEVKARIATAADIGTVLWTQPGSMFAIAIVQSPGPVADSVILYGVVNIQTGVIEAYLNSFAKAIYLAKEFQLDLANGYDRPANRPGLPASIAAMLSQQQGGGDDDLPPSGKAN